MKLEFVRIVTWDLLIILLMFMPTGWKPSARFRHFFYMFLGVGWGGVGLGNNVHVLAHSHDVTPRHVHLHVRTYVMLRWRCVTSRRGGVGWGGAITFTYLRTHIAKTNLSKRSADMLEKPSGFILAPSTRAGVWSKPVFPISWHLAQKTNKNWMTSFGRTFAHGSGDGRRM